MKNLVLRGSTGRLFLVFLLDSASTTGAGKTGLTNASAALNISVRRELSAAFTTYTGANLLGITTLGTWAAPGAGKIRFKEVDATNAPGLYELQLEDALVDAADASRWLAGMITATGVAPTPFELPLVAVNVQDAVRFGLTALPNAAAEAAGGLYTRGTGAGQINQPANGMVDSNVVRWLGTAASTPTVAGVPNVNVKTWNDLTTVALPLVPATAGRALVVDAAGLADATAVKLGPTGAGTAQTARDVGASVLLSSGTGTGQVSLAAGLVDITQTAADKVWGTTVRTLSAAGVQAIWDALTSALTTAGSVGKRIADFLSVTPLTATQVENAVWDATASSHNTALTTGNKLNAAASAGDPWNTALPGAYGAGTAGKIVGDNITGNAFTRLGAPAGASVSADVAAVKGVLPTALVSGRIDASVGAMASGVVTATAIAADAITAAKIAPDAIGASELAADAVAEIADQVWDEVLSGHLTAGTTGAALNGASSAGDPWGTALPGAYGAGSAGKIVGDNLNATVSSRSTYAGTDTAGTTTLLSRLAAALTITGGKVDVNDKTGFSLSAGGVQAIWDALTSALTTAGSIGKRIADFLTGDAFVRLGAPVGASHSADVAAVKVDTAAIKAKTDNLPTDPADASDLVTVIGAVTTAISAKLPAALVGGRMDANASAIGGDATAATNLRQSALSIYVGSVTGAATTTTLIDSALTQGNDFWIGKVLTFTSGALFKQSTTITDFIAATDQLVFAALTGTPAGGDTYVIY